MKSFSLRSPFLLIGVGLLGLFIGVSYGIVYGSNTFEDAERKVFFISKGEHFSEVMDSLESQGIIRNRSMFEVVAMLFGGTSSLKVGKYIFESGASNAHIFQTLRSGGGNQLIHVTVLEGTFARTQARIFAKAVGIDSSRYIRNVYDSSFARALGIEASTLEGYLLPETYAFTWQQDEGQIIRALFGHFEEFFGDSLRKRADEMGMTVHEVMTLASIVEGEAILNEERPIISGVYHNRLRRGMRLEADPTIQFILPDGPRRLLYADLEIDNPYNTYRNRGLPPGPVNNPGKASILAALYPAQHNYLYFVANGKGGHWFSRSYEEHRRYVQMYRRERGRSRSAQK
ncbi:MAG: endolytic transglycosylase MltG [Bacteroidota bacterium]